VTGGLLVLVYGIVKAPEYGWGSVKTIGLGVVALALLASFVAIELRSKAPLIRLGILRLRSLSSSNVAMLLVASGLFSMFYFAGIYLQEVRHYGPLKAGLAFVPFTAGIVIGAGASQALIKRIGIRNVVTIGLILGTIGMLYFLELSTTSGYLAHVFPSIAVMSIGMGMTFVPLTLLATTNVDVADAGLASGLFNTSQQVGGALGLAVLSTLANSHTTHLLHDGVDRPSAITRGFHVAFGGGAVLLAASIAIILLFIRRKDVEAIQTDGQMEVAVEAA
jgi:predicted MFS family arabinose efflux permease